MNKISKNMEYISSETQNLLARKYKIAVFIALTAAILVLILMLAAKFVQAPEIVQGTELLVKPIYATVLVTGLLVIVIRRGITSRFMIGLFKSEKAAGIITKLLAGTLICVLLGEAIGIAGFVLYIMTGDVGYSFRLGIIGLLIIVYSIPRRSEWERLVSTLEK